MHPIEVLLVPLGRAFRGRRAGDAASIANSPDLATNEHFTLTSSGFGEGREIPAKYCGWLIGDNVSPALSWGTLPAGTTNVVLLFEDIDGPGTTPRVHTIVEFIPSGNGIAEGALETPAVSFAPRNGKPGRYAGPRPLPGHGSHCYRFHLYAIDTHVDVSAITDPEQLPGLLAGRVLASGTLTGTRTS
jgi:phosphatidylethanolamine-binding protein (PEBP) family uncharacterized protein